LLGRENMPADGKIVRKSARTRDGASRKGGHHPPSLGRAWEKQEDGVNRRL